MAKATGLRKRSQITKANRTMFIWVASMSAIAMICLVVSYHLIQTIVFNGRVIAQKAQTIGNLQTSNKNVEELQSQIRALDTNENLAMVKASPEDKALQVVLDALPATANPLSFGASLQTVLLVGPEGLNIKSISVASDESEVVEETGTTEETFDENGEVVENESVSETTATPMTFTFVVEGNEIALQEVLQRLEKSIRTVYVDTINIQRQGDTNEMSVSGHVFYQLEKTVDLQKKVVK